MNERVDVGRRSKIIFLKTQNSFSELSQNLTKYGDCELFSGHQTHNLGRESDFVARRLQQVPKWSERFGGDDAEHNQQCLRGSQDRGAGRGPTRHIQTPIYTRGTAYDSNLSHF